MMITKTSYKWITFTTESGPPVGVNRARVISMRAPPDFPLLTPRLLVEENSHGFDIVSLAATTRQNLVIKLDFGVKGEFFSTVSPDRNRFRIPDLHGGELLTLKVKNSSSRARHFHAMLSGRVI